MIIIFLLVLDWAMFIRLPLEANNYYLNFVGGKKYLTSSMGNFIENAFMRELPILICESVLISATIVSDVKFMLNIYSMPLFLLVLASGTILFLFWLHMYFFRLFIGSALPIVFRKMIFKRFFADYLPLIFTFHYHHLSFFTMFLNSSSDYNNKIFVDYLSDIKVQVESDDFFEYLI
ncbi:hypothetical protein ACJX0J_022561 [Zea mays]